MLRALSIRDFVVVATLDLELEPGFSVLTGETGAGKSILLDALALLLGDRFEPGQIRPGAERAELAAAFDVDDAPAVRAWLADEGVTRDDGEVLVEGKQTHFKSPHESREVGIEMIYQDFALCGNLDVAANIFLGRWPTRGWFVDRKAMERDAWEVLRRLKVDVNHVRQRVESLSGGSCL